MERREKAKEMMMLQERLIEAREDLNRDELKRCVSCGERRVVSMH